MTDRGPQIVNPARACPFVAFVDERDERATVPDHRHRCYAEEVPAPRALAHQEAYCLSSNFPVCPTFQDWAKREAAQARDVPGAATLASGTAMAAASAADDEDLAGRERRRDWAAPPAWRSDADDDIVAEPPLSPPVSSLGGSPAAASPPPFSPAASPPAGLGSAAIPGGLSGSLADRMAGGRDEEVGTPGNRRDWEDANRAWGEATRAKIDDVDEWGDDTGRLDRAALVGGAAVAGGAVAGRRDATAWPREDREPAGRTVADREAVAPSWERPKRFEAYPALGSRRGLPVVPLVIGLIVIAVAALLLFKLPEFLGVGAPAATASPSPSTVISSEQPPPTTPTSSAEASAEAPGASPITYQVQPGDTMTKIANKFSVPLQDLIDANKDTVKNPSNLVVGQTLIIPTVAPTTLPDAGTQAP
jgi:LysM repeat protein